MKKVKGIIVKALAFFLVFTVICGVLYTGVITALSQLLFPDKANGSMIEVNGKKYGCELLGQQYTDENHMWGRIMNIDVTTYQDEEGNPLMYADPSNLSPASEEYEQLVKERVEKIKKAHPEMGDASIPVDLVTCSGSGLDPHISKEAAEYQVLRVATNNGLTKNQVEDIIDACTTSKVLGVFGEETVNVLKVNLMIDGILE